MVNDYMLDKVLNKIKCLLGEKIQIYFDLMVYK